jgi:hypothetical protein
MYTYEYIDINAYSYVCKHIYVLDISQRDLRFYCVSSITCNCYDWRFINFQEMTFSFLFICNDVLLYIYINLEII